MPRKCGRQSVYEDDDYGDYYDDYYDEEEEEKATPAVKNPFRASGASELGKALFSPLPRSKLKKTTWTFPIKELHTSAGGVSVSRGAREDELLRFPPPSAVNIAVVPFKFDTPSPDDKVRISQSGTKASSARVPSMSIMAKSTVAKATVAAKSKGVTNIVDSRQVKSKTSARSSESSAMVNKESLESERSVRDLAKSKVVVPDTETAVLEDLMHMTLDGDYREEGKGMEHSSGNPSKQLTLDTYVPEGWILEEIKAERKPLLHLIVIGHVDAGKSTLMGHILHLLGRVSKKEIHKNERESKEKGKGSFAYAWALDEGAEERARGVTMTVAVAHFETSKLRVVLLDAPGHKDFVPNMISGAAQADAAVLVVDASLGAFEAGLDGEGQNGGQTREHAQLIRSLGVEQLIVAVNKMDIVDYSQQRFKLIKDALQPFLKQCGFKGSAIRWIPVSAIDGQNLVAPASAASLASWYSGSTLLDAVDLFEQPLRNTLKPLRLIIAELVRSRSLGQVAVSGKLESGAIQIGSKVLIMPIGETASVKYIEQEGKAVHVALAGDNVDVGLMGVEPGVLTPGGVLCHPHYPVPVAIRLEVRVVMLGRSVPILRGEQVVLHAHHAREAAQISDLVAVLDSKTGAVTKRKPRCLTANQSALIEIIPERSICVEEYAQFKALGRIALRDAGKTLAVGIITQVLSQL